MNTAFHDPDQVKRDFIARKRRQRRLQLFAPQSYWNRYRAEEIAREEAQLKRMEAAMDRIGIFTGIICISLFIAMLCFHERIFWLPPLISIGAVIWWVGWGRHQYQ
ncbi:MAG: hypothetical protein GX808_03880 [Syntrophomonadaceae bacterium]|jgi:hypothetical protein|nr:hypothetical protein [Syntrophomonadaceae bacterium]